MDQQERVNILVVDDRPEKLVTIEAVLEDLGQNIVCASSGREALRQLSHREFAVILLDISMPGMDGFKTAEIIREQLGFKHTPIIFMTAFGDDFFLERSYALGAVDYLLVPFNPDVLRTKVSVFVELFARTEQVRRQAAALERRAGQLHKLTVTSMTISAAPSLDAILGAITRAARDIVGAHQAMMTMAGIYGEPSQTVCSLSDKYANFHPAIDVADDLYRFACAQCCAVRLTQGEIECHPAWIASVQEGRRPPLEGWLATPLIEREGRIMGLIQLSDKIDGDFTEDDEAIVVQLAQLGSIAIQNCLQAEAREANRLKDEFLATLSHELRTPLHAILGWTRLLQTGTRDAEGIRHGLEVIERNAAAQTRLIEELLDVARITTGKLRLESHPISLCQLVRAAIDALRPGADAKRIVIASSLDGSCWVVGDVDRLHQVASNLLSNAIKFTPAGGRVDVSLRSEGDCVELSVRDSGEGISAEFLPFVFERFRQADTTNRRAQGGLGIGLAVVRDVIALHNGSIRAESEGRGRGATFRITLPAIRSPFEVSLGDAVSSSAEPVSREPAASIAGLRVLLVEDDADARQLLRKILQDAEVEVIAAASVREALESLDRGFPDVLVSDIGMPGEDGYDLIRSVRGRAPETGGDLPAMAVTAYAGETVRNRALASGFQIVLGKPTPPSELLQAVAQLAESGRGGRGGAAWRRMIE